METDTEFNNRFKVPPGFHRVEFDGTDLNEDCLEDEEIVLIKAPLSFSFETVKSKIKLNGSVKNLSQESTKQYESSFSTDLPDQFKYYDVLIPGKAPGQLESISKKISGYLVFSENVDIPEWEAPPIVEKYVPFPEGLKPRFAPFGAQETKSKSKRKKKKSLNATEVDSSCVSSPEKSRFGEVSREEGNTSLGKKRKKTEEENESSPEKKSKKEKKKKKRLEDETEDTQSSPEKKHSVVANISGISVETNSPDKHKKKKKKKKKNDESLQEKTILDKLINELPTISPKKEMKWPSYIESSPQNKKKSKAMDETVLSEGFNKSEGKKRKKKKQKTEIESNFNSNTKVETEQNATANETKDEKTKKPKEKSLTENEKSPSKKKKKKSSS